MNLAINMIYTGECSVHRNMRHELIELCTLLQLKGVEGLVEEVTIPRIIQTTGIDEEDIDFDIGPDEAENSEQQEVEMDDLETYEEDDDMEKTEELDSHHGDQMVFINEKGEVFNAADQDSPTITFSFDPTNQTNQSFSVPSKKLKQPETERNLFEAKRPGLPRVIKTEAGFEIECTPAPTPKPKIELDFGQKEILQKRLVHLIQKTYTNLGTRGHETLAQLDHRARLVFKDNLLLKGNFNCVLCDKDIAVVYTTDKKGKFKQWINSNMKRHMKRIHKDLHNFNNASDTTQQMD